MAKSSRRRPSHRRRARPARSRRAKRPGGRSGQARPKVSDRGLIARILETPHLARVIPQLQPGVLHRVIERYGLEDCTDLVALASAEQLSRVFDLDLWRSARPGRDEQFDARRFGVWLEVLLESGAEMAADKIAGMDVDLVAGALAHHVAVFDGAAASPYTTSDGTEMPGRRSAAADTCAIGGYLMEARRADAWDAIAAVLRQLDEQHHGYFTRVMRECRRLSNDGFERDGLHDLLDDRDQDVFDLAAAREERRDREGFVAAAEARTFLQMARRFDLAGAAPARHPIAHAYFRMLSTIDRTSAGAADEPGLADVGEEPASAPPESTEGVAAIVELLRDAGVIGQPPRALLGAASDTGPAPSRFQWHMQVALDSDGIAGSRRSEELAFLANCLIAGCSLQARAFTADEASEAAVAVCNLGLEHWPRRWLRTGAPPSAAAATLPDDFLVEHDLVAVFEVGWAILHRDVVMLTARTLIETLDALGCQDPSIQDGLQALRVDLLRGCGNGTPWDASESLDVIMLLDQPSWAALVATIAEFPVLHASIVAANRPGARVVEPAAFEFITGNRQIAMLRSFLESLPAVLATA